MWYYLKNINTLLSLTHSGWINASQYSQYGICGLQATTLGYHLTFDIMRKDFVQILHNGEDHWFTISTLGLPSGHVNIYESLSDLY